MAKVGTNASANAVREASLGANVVKQARRKTAAESLVEYADGVIVRIVARSSEPHQMDVALVYVFFRDQVIAGRSGLVLNLIFRNCRTFGPRVECGVQLGFHRGGIEVSTNAENNVVGMHVLAVPVNQILSRYRGHSRVFGLAGVRIIGAVGQFHGLAASDFANFVVASRDGI